MSRETPQVYEFGPFRLDARKRLLWRGGEVVPLTPKVFETLRVLVERRGQQVTKDELMREVWGETIVEETNLTANISHLRKALGEKKSDHQYIVTVPGEGYRFVAGVKEIGGERTALIAQEGARASIPIEEEENGVQEEERFIAAARGERRLWPRVMTACVLLAVLIAAAVHRLGTRQPEAPAPSGASVPINSIAVLPFKPLAASNRDEPLELGMAETLITRLSNLKEVTVRPMSAVRRYTGLEQDAAAAGRELRVESVLDGNIQRAGDRIRVSVRLVRVGDGKQLWAEAFDESFKDIFAVQDSISERVAGALALKLTGEERERLAKRHTKNSEAYQLYLRGRYFWNRGTEEGLRKAIEHFLQALEKDPDYALAYTGLADSYALLGVYGLIPMRESHPKAREAATRALEFDEKLGEAHASLAAVLIDYYWDWAGAERHLERALELNPNYATAHSMYANYLKAFGRFGEAIEEAKRAQGLDPVSPSSNLTLATTYYFARQYDQAIEQSQGAVTRCARVGSELRPGARQPRVRLRAKEDVRRGNLRISEGGSAFRREPRYGGVTRVRVRNGG
jgi:DNA-binding winged helix-turn-helix (wHTH) protein/TolB-like protein